MKKNFLRLMVLAGMLSISVSVPAQVDFTPIFTQIRLEARADFDYFNTSEVNYGPTMTDYGFRGRYFNLCIGGPLNEQFSYFFRQRIVAKPGDVSLFDNTDFLYVNYMPTKNWMFRAGKDALAVGGIEYDASPIDVLFSTNYWDNFYCFQPAVAAAYKSDDGNQMILAQVANSPYVHYGATNLGYASGNEWMSGLMAYSLYWSGKFDHFKVLHSINMFERPDHGYMNYIALGHLIEYKRWDCYLDLIHHANGWSDWGNNFAVVTCANLYLESGLSFFVKGAYEQNYSEDALPGFGLDGNLDLGFYDCFVEAGHSYTTYGLGAEYRPKSCPAIRLHAFVANRCTQWEETVINETVDMKENRINANVGITWDMDIHKMLKDRIKGNL